MQKNFQSLLLEVFGVLELCHSGHTSPLLQTPIDLPLYLNIRNLKPLDGLYLFFRGDSLNGSIDLHLVF